MPPRKDGLPYNRVYACNTIDLFKARVSKRGPDECWPWTGTINHEFGYGTFRIKCKTYGAHRLAWEIANERPPPPGMCVCHKCDNPPCCNPAHLFLGTHKDNDNDRISKGRQAKGMGHGCAVLDDVAVLIMRAARTDGARVSDIAKAAQVSKFHTYKILAGKAWSHLNGVAA